MDTFLNKVNGFGTIIIITHPDEKGYKYQKSNRFPTIAIL
jgi:hypothetical protein